MQKRELCSQSLHVYLQPKRFAFQNAVVNVALGRLAEDDFGTCLGGRMERDRVEEGKVT